jgi:hypothetical protein
MHPPLDRPHPDCGLLIEALKACHTANPYAKFWGECNDAKALMDRCFREEKERSRSENLRVSREFDAKFEAYIEGREKNPPSAKAK